MVRTKLAIECCYLGAPFIGWQPQGTQQQGSIEAAPQSVYEVLHEALCACGYASGPVASGRTDKGVNAQSMWCTIGVKRSSPPIASSARDTELLELCASINEHLPATVRCKQILDALPDAHAMTGAAGKTYSFYVLHGADAACNDAWRDACWVLGERLDVDGQAL